MNIFEWLRSKGFDYTWNVSLGGKTPDVVAFKEGEVVAFEIKKHGNEVVSAIGQCLHYLKEANKVYIVLPRVESRSLKSHSLSVLKKRGIGLIGFDKKFNILLEAKRYPLSSKVIIERLKKKSLSQMVFFDSKEIIKRKLLETIEAHPEGLTIADLSKILGLHRQTVTKYVLVLEATGIIHRRRVGSATLHYMKKKFLKIIKNKRILKKSRL